MSILPTETCTLDLKRIEYHVKEWYTKNTAVVPNPLHLTGFGGLMELFNMTKCRNITSPRAALDEYAKIAQATTDHDLNDAITNNFSIRFTWDEKKQQLKIDKVNFPLLTPSWSAWFKKQYTEIQKKLSEAQENIAEYYDDTRMSTREALGGIIAAPANIVSSFKKEPQKRLGMAFDAVKNLGGGAIAAGVAAAAAGPVGAAVVGAAAAAKYLTDSNKHLGGEKTKRLGDLVATPVERLAEKSKELIEQMRRYDPQISLVQLDADNLIEKLNSLGDFTTLEL
jgi:hypothetical protein